MESRNELINEMNILQDVFEASPAAMMVVDKSTTIKMVNRGVEKILGYHRNDLEDKRRWTDMVISEDRDILKNLLRKLRAEGGGLPDKYECRLMILQRRRSGCT